MGVYDASVMTRAVFFTLRLKKMTLNTKIWTFFDQKRRKKSIFKLFFLLNQKMLSKF